MNGKRIFAMFLVLVLVFALVGCAKTDTEVKAAQETTAASGKNDPQTTSPQEPEVGGIYTLVYEFLIVSLGKMMVTQMTLEIDAVIVHLP